jgi:serine/threonine protein kinase
VTSPGPAIERASLAAATRCVLKRGRGIKPDVLLVATPRGQAVVKDYAPRASWVRGQLGGGAGLGCWLARREQRIYQVLADVDAVPALLGPIDDLAFAVEYRPGEPLSRMLGERLGAESAAGFLRALEASVQAMHQRGVVHLDLRHRDNVLMDEQARPVLVDFAAAMCFRPGSVWDRWFRPTVLVYDRRALDKWRDRLRPGAPPSPRSTWRRLRRWRATRRRRTPPPQHPPAPPG